MSTCSVSTGPVAGSASPSVPRYDAFRRERITLPSTTTRGGQVISQIKAVVASGVLALSLVAMAGCGGGSKNNNASTTATTSTTQTTTTPSGGGGSNLTLSADPSGALKFTKNTPTGEGGQ